MSEPSSTHRPKQAELATIMTLLETTGELDDDGFLAPPTDPDEQALEDTVASRVLTTIGLVPPTVEPNMVATMILDIEEWLREATHEVLARGETLMAPRKEMPNPDLTRRGYRVEIEADLDPEQGRAQLWILLLGVAQSSAPTVCFSVSVTAPDGAIFTDITNRRGRVALHDVPILAGDYVVRIEQHGCGAAEFPGIGHPPCNSS